MADDKKFRADRFAWKAGDVTVTPPRKQRSDKGKAHKTSKVSKKGKK